MKTITIDGKDVSISDDSFEELKKSLVDDGVPKEGTMYWYLSADNNVQESRWRDFSWHQFRLDIGNCFKTREEAIEKESEIRALAKVNRYIRENNLRSDEPSKNYYVYKNYNKSFDVGSTMSIERKELIGPLKSSNAAHQIINNCEAELKIIFNVE